MATPENERAYVEAMMDKAAEEPTEETLLTMLSGGFADRVAALGDPQLTYEFEDLRDKCRSEYNQLVCVDKIKELLPAFRQVQGFHQWQKWPEILGWVQHCSVQQRTQLKRECDLDIGVVNGLCRNALFNEQLHLLTEPKASGSQLRGANDWEALGELVTELRRFDSFDNLEFDPTAWNRVVVDALAAPQIKHFAFTPSTDTSAYHFRMLACRALADGDRGQLAMLLAWLDRHHRQETDFVPAHVFEDLYSAFIDSLKKERKRKIKKK